MTEIDRHTRRSGEDYADGLAGLLPTGAAWSRDPDGVLMKLVRGLGDLWSATVDKRAADLLERESDPQQTIELLPDWERNFGLPDECVAEPLTIADRQKALVERMTTEGGQSREFMIAAAARIGYQIAITEYSPFMCGISRCGDTRPVGEFTSTSDTTANPGTGPGAYGFNLLSAPATAYTVGQIIRVSSQDNPYLWFQGEVTAYAHPLLSLNVTAVSGVSGSSSTWRVEDARVLHRWEIGPIEMRFYWSVKVGAVRLTWFRVGYGGGQVGVDPHLRIAIATDLECLLNRYKPGHTIINFDYSGLGAPDPMAGTP